MLNIILSAVKTSNRPFGPKNLKVVVMALEKIFFDPRALKRFGGGHLASKRDGFCECLSKRGFARATMRSF